MYQNVIKRHASKLIHVNRQTHFVIQNLVFESINKSSQPFFVTIILFKIASNLKKFK